MSHQVMITSAQPLSLDDGGHFPFVSQVCHLRRTVIALSGRQHHIDPQPARWHCVFLKKPEIETYTDCYIFTDMILCKGQKENHSNYCLIMNLTMLLRLVFKKIVYEIFSRIGCKIIL